MTALRVVEHLDVVEYIGSCIASGRIDSTTDALALEQLEEALGHSVIMAVASPAHAADQIVVTQEGLPLVAGKLTALIGVNQNRRLRLAAPKRHQQRIKDQADVDAATHGPSDLAPVVPDTVQSLR